MVLSLSILRDGKVSLRVSDTLLALLASLGLPLVSMGSAGGSQEGQLSRDSMACPHPR